MEALAPITPKFWLQEQVSEEQFIQKADTFDILLFKTRTSAAKMTRAWTKSEFGKQSDPSFCATSHSNLPRVCFLFECRPRGNGDQIRG